MKAPRLLPALLLVLAACGQPPTRWVDPFIGTDAHGHVHPGATVPFGMVQLGPDNGRGGWDWTSGYHWSDSVITGFSHTHLSGTGIGDLTDILFAPVSDSVDLAWRAEDDGERPPWASSFSHANEEAEPGYYAVTLDRSGVRAELTATTRTGVHRYTFPAGSRPGLVIDLAHTINWDRPTETVLEVVDDTTVVGHRHSTGWAADQRLYFVARFSTPIEDAILVDAGALLRFGGGAPVVVRVGLSYVDRAGALANLEAEARGGFDGTREAAREAWNEALGGVRVRGGDPASLRTFYTALYRTRLAPIVFQDVDGRYRGGDGAIHRARDGTTRYSIFSLWDTFRAQHPLLTIVEPDRVDDLVRSMLGFAAETGWLPVWELVGNETNTMTGFHAVPVIADAYLKGFRGFDADAALDAMVHFAERDWRGLDHYRRYGYVPSELEKESVTKTLEYAYDDAAIARMARAMGRDSLADAFEARSASWRNVFDTWTGFARGRTADGGWVEPFDPFHASHREDTDYTEGNAWQHSWFVPHDVRGLIDRMGGDEAFIAKLDALFDQDTTLTGENVSPDISGMIGQYAHGNEPSHHIAYLYAWAGAPWRTQDRARQIMSTLYDDSPAGLPGNEDCGQLSAWYVLSALGFYPADPVGGVYVLSSPLFEKAEIDVGDGRTFTVLARDASVANRYIQSAELNGEPLDRAWIHHDEVVAGGTLRLVMGPEPNHAWAADRDAAPPSATVVPPAAAMADRIRDELRHAWNGYVAHAWGHDALRPLSREPHDWYDAPLYLTPLDAYDTMLLMGLDQEAAAAKALVLDSLTFDHDMAVQLFEVTIRVLGGLLSAYQLDGDARWLDLATDLGDRLMPAFASATGMPYRFVNLHTGAVRGRVNNPAEIGTLTLELGTLSRLTGDPRYFDAVKRAATALFQRRSALGLVGTSIDVETGEWRDADSHVSGMIDSYYEYLLKAELLFDDDDFRAMYDTSMSAVHTYLADEHPDGLWYGHADMATGERTATRFGALDAFMPGMLALAGDLDRAERLMASVHRMWLEHGIEPERMDYADRSVVAPQYLLRPEAIESAYVLYRLTGERMYRDMGRVMVQSIMERARTETAYAELASVVTGELQDGMESFFLAETLKYAWLLFAPEDALDFEQVVFNTEAHPLRRTW